MKNLLILITIMLVGGCGKGNQTADESPKANPVKELTPEEQKALRDSVVGEYEFKDEDGDTIKLYEGIGGYIIGTHQVKDLQAEASGSNIRIKIK